MDRDAGPTDETAAGLVTGDSPVGGGSDGITSGTILVVDDEKSLRWSLAEGLREDGYDVKEAENGTQCFEVLGAHPVDVVLLDLKLPGEDGLTIIKRIKAE